MPGTCENVRAQRARIAALAGQRFPGEWRAVEVALDQPDPALAVVRTAVDLHRRWRVLRRSLRRLVARDERVREAYLRARDRQLATLARLHGGDDREADALLLYTMERAADAIADGEPEVLGLSEDRLVAKLAERVRATTHLTA